LIVSSLTIFWGCTGFDLVHVPRSASRGLWLASLKNYRKINANENSIVGDFAPSLEEADAILAKFGYVDRDEQVLLAA